MSAKRLAKHLSTELSSKSPKKQKMCFWELKSKPVALQNVEAWDIKLSHKCSISNIIWIMWDVYFVIYVFVMANKRKNETNLKSNLYSMIVK